MFDPLSWIDDELARLEQAGLRRVLSVREGPQDPAAIRWQGQTLLNFGSNDYLGFAARLATPAWSGDRGWGSGASPLVTGRGEQHAALERELAEFEGTEAALLFPTGYAANVGTVAALAGREDLIFSDAKNHASLIDGCRLSGAAVRVYRHLDLDDLSRGLAESHGFRRRLIVTDGLFSMDGDVAPVDRLVELAAEHRALLIVDEAHATGVLGERGRGACEACGCEAAVPVRIGTLSKALGSLGGFVAGRRSLVEWLANRARTYVFSTAAPEAVAAAAREALRLVVAEPWRRIQLLLHAEELRTALRTQGWKTGGASPIVPVYLGEPRPAVELAARLRDAGFLVPAIRPPSVPVGESLLRISLSAAHSREDIERLVAALATLRATCAGPSFRQ